jgi:2-phosphoglycerate kinase
MFNVCPKCGVYSVEKVIEPEGPFAVCPHCGYRHRFLRLPLFVITGASGTGKSAVCLELPRKTSECVFLECDLFWCPHFDKPEEDYRSFRDHCLRVAKSIGQSGRPVVLCGTVVPDGYEISAERRYFTEIHYLALVCEDEELKKRLTERPGWRRSSQPEFIRNMTDFNQWIKDNAHKTQPPMTILDNTHLSVEGTVERIAEWIHGKCCYLDTRPSQKLLDF